MNSMNTAPDWLAAVAGILRDAGDEFGLAQLRAGDVLRIETGHTVYVLRMVEGREAELATGRADRPSGRVRIQGCTFGDSSSIKPDSLFCGGNLEFTFDEGRMVHRTTSIRAICHASCR